jgi:MFS family permease
MEETPRLGRDYAKLWTASAVSNVGDGMMLAAGPLLLASLTDDPALVGGAVFAQQLPWLLFALVSGVYVDRLDRRRLIVVVNLCRGAIVAGLAAAVWADVVTVPLVYLVCFLLGTAETLADNAFSALLPGIVSSRALPRANARLFATNIVGNQLGGPPLGAYLFVVAAAVPFGLDAATFVAAALLIGALRHRPAEPPTEAERRGLRADIAEGVRALWHHPVLRMIALCLCLMNVTLMAAFSLLVLYARERLGLPPVGYGVLLAMSAAGALLGTLVVSRLERRFGAAWVLRVGLVIETATHLVLALDRIPWVAAVTLFVFGVHAACWGTIAVTVRQRAVPDRLRGRTNSVYFLFGVGGSALGALLGGLVARPLGLTAPFWGAFAIMIVLTAVAWRLFTPAAMAAPLTDSVSVPATAGLP